MPMTVESRIRQMQIFNLPHDVYCRSTCSCSDVTMLVGEENPRTGERAHRHVSKRAPASLTFLALERKSGLPVVLLEVPDVRAALAKGHLRIVEQTADTPPPLSKPPDASAPASLHEAVSAALPREG